MAGLLEQTLVQWASTPCSKFPCAQDAWDYACRVSGRELIPLPPHDTEEQKDAIINQAGGLVKLVNSWLVTLDWVETDPEHLQPGDIGVLEMSRVGQICAIYTGRRWALRANNQVVLIPKYAAAVWMVWRKP